MTAKKSLKEAAFCLGISWRTLYRWVLEGKVSYVQFEVNCPIFIPEEEIKRLSIKLTPKVCR